MKKILLAGILSALLTGVVQAASLTALNVDTAPNRFGSPNWAPWWSATQTDVVAGTFQDMRSSALNSPGDLLMDPLDEIVYSTGDLGHRLHWVYWLDNTSTSALNGLFEVRVVFDWDGVDYTYDWGTGTYVAPTPNAGWSQPGTWENYNNGVIGSFGWAWWAVDDDAAPFNSDASPYNETNQADIEALRDIIFDYQTYARGEVRFRNSISEDWTVQALHVDILQPVPIPGAAGLGLLGLGLVAVRRRFRKVA